MTAVGLCPYRAIESNKSFKYTALAGGLAPSLVGCPNIYQRVEEERQWKCSGQNLNSPPTSPNQSIQQWHNTQLPRFPGRKNNFIGEFGGKNPIGHSTSCTSMKISNTQWQSRKVISALLKAYMAPFWTKFRKAPVPSEKKGWAETPTKGRKTHSPFPVLNDE